MKEFEQHELEEWEDPEGLRSLKKNAFFKEPEGYFDRIPDILRDRLAEQDPIESAPLLSGLELKAYFQEPAGYFDTFPDRMQSLIAPSPRMTIHRLWKQALQPRHSLSVAAVLLLFVLGVWVMPPAQSVESSDLTSEELLAMVDMDAFDTEMLLEILGEEAIESVGLLEEWEIPESEVSDLLNEMDLDDIDPAEFW